MDVTTVSEKVVTRVSIHLSREEAQELRALLYQVPGTAYGRSFYRELLRALKGLRDEQ